MKYRNLKITFSIEDVLFTVLSIGHETFINPIPKHSHSKNSFELHYIAEGYGTLISDGNAYDITPGTFFMTGPGIAHEQISAPHYPMAEYGVYLQIHTPHTGSKGLFMPSFLKHTFWFGSAQTQMEPLMKQIFSELENHTYGYELMLPALLEQLILLVTRLYEKDCSTSSLLVTSPIQPDDLIYLTIEEAFLYNYRTLTLDTLAKEVNLGRRQTERLLQKHYNKTFSQKKTEARMSAASLLLLETHKSIATIAEELGYSSAEHFASAFKHYYHLTPTAYRKKLQTPLQV